MFEFGSLRLEKFQCCFPQESLVLYVVDSFLQKEDVRYVSRCFAFLRKVIEWFEMYKHVIIIYSFTRVHIPYCSLNCNHSYRTLTTFTIFPLRSVTFIVHQIQLNISIAILFQNAKVSVSGDSFLGTWGTFASLFELIFDKQIIGTQMSVLSLDKLYLATAEHWGIYLPFYIFTLNNE